VRRKPLPGFPFRSRAGIGRELVARLLQETLARHTATPEQTHLNRTQQAGRWRCGERREIPAVRLLRVRFCALAPLSHIANQAHGDCGTAFSGAACALNLRPLNAGEGADILKLRMGSFRLMPPTSPTELFPYEEDAIEYLFSDGAKVVGYLLDVCDGSLKETMEDIASGKSPSPMVTWRQVQRYIEVRLRKVAPKRKG
jgi:hypothetical protein